jgi:hypothetical protein
MENIILSLRSKKSVNDYAKNYCHVKYEREIIAEISQHIESGNMEMLAWINGFGNSMRAILMNVHAYRKGLEFGFATIAFDKYGWFHRPEFLEKEDIKLGDSDRYGEYSIIHLGRGENQTWTYGMNYSFGTAGGGYGLSVYGKKFNNRPDTLTFSLNELKQLMAEKIGNPDTTNYKQAVIAATLKAIAQVQVNMVQLTLF